MEISKIAIELLKEIYTPNILYRAVGIVLEKIGEQSIEQLSLYSQADVADKKYKLTKCIDKLEKKFRKNIIKTGFTDKKQ